MRYSFPAWQQITNLEKSLEEFCSPLDPEKSLRIEYIRAEDSDYPTGINLRGKDRSDSLRIFWYYNKNKHAFYSCYFKYFPKEPPIETPAQTSGLRGFLYPLQQIDGPGLVYKNGKWCFFSYTRFELLSDKTWSRRNTSWNEFCRFIGKPGLRRLNHLYTLCGMKRNNQSQYFSQADRNFLIDALNSIEKHTTFRDFLSYLDAPNNLYTQSFLSFERVIKTAVLAFYHSTIQTQGFSFERFNPMKTLDDMKNYLVPDLNPFIAWHQRNKISYFGNRGIHENAKHYVRRMYHPSYLGFIGAFHTPESERIGLVQELASGSRLHEDLLYNDFSVDSIKKPLCIDDIVEKSYSFSWDIQGLEQNPSFFQHAPLEHIELSDEGNAFSEILRLLPFAAHNDASRLLMAVKNTKQALPLIYGEEPALRTIDYATFKSALSDFFNGKEYGVNLMTAYLPYKGYNFEDGIVISETAAEKLTSIHHIYIDIEIKNGWFLRPPASGNLFELSTDSGEEAKNLAAELHHSAPSYHFSVFCEVITCRPKSPRIVKLLSLVKLPENTSLPWDNTMYTFRIPSDMTAHYALCVEEKRKAAVGDKIIARHANKGIISRIIPDSEMPWVEVDTKAEVLINPMSVVSRMNIGQLMEVAYASDDIGSLPLFKTFEQKDFVKTKRGWYDAEKEFELLAGLQYFYKLNHCAEDKLYYNSNPRTNALGLYVKGKRFNGGMRLGEMELWGLQAHGAYDVLDRLLNNMSFRADEGLSPSLKLFAWYLLMLKLCLEFAGEDGVFRPFYTMEGVASDYIESYRFVRISNLDEVIDFFDPSDPNIETISVFEKHCSGDIPRFIPVHNIPSSHNFELIDLCNNDKSIVTKFKGSPGVLAIPGSYLISEKKTSITDELSTKIYKRILNSGKKAARPYPLISDKKNDSGYSSVIALISGKSGILRSQLLGRRIKNSGRAVIVPEPELRINEIALPGAIDILRNDTDRVLMVRYPSLFKYNIQEYQVNNSNNYPYAVKINPLICSMIAGDFDGDTMTFISKPELFQDLPRLFSPEENLFNEGTGKLFLHLTQDLQYAYHLAIRYDDLAKIMDRCGLKANITIKASSFHRLSDFTESLYSQFNNRADYLRTLEQLARELFSYISFERPFSISIWDIIGENGINKPNHIREIIASGARGNAGHWKKMTEEISAGLYAGPEHRGIRCKFIIPRPLCSGLSALQLAMFSNDARAGLGEKKLKTPDGGAFNRRLHEILYEVKISEVLNAPLLQINHNEMKSLFFNVSKVIPGLLESDMKNYFTDFLKLRRINGRVDTKQAAEDLIAGNVSACEISSPLVWNFSNEEIPAACFGPINLSEQTGFTPQTRIGILAASIIGEQATQLALKSFQGAELVPLDIVEQILSEVCVADSDLLQSAFALFILYGGTVRADFIELLLKYVKDKNHDTKFNIISYQSMPWKSAIENMSFGFVRNNIRSLYEEADSGIEREISDSFKARLIFNATKRGASFHG